jgi:hypothetical protein
MKAGSLLNSMIREKMAGGSFALQCGICKSPVASIMQSA